MKNIYLYLILLLLLAVSCMDRYVIPGNINQSNPGNFGAGDTTFLQLNPIWDDAYGLSEPTEISIAQDGRIFVADLNAILVFDQDGTMPSGFDGLKNLTGNSGAAILPIDVDIDQKMNVFFIDGSHQIFIWNHYWNEVGINSVSVSGTFLHTETGIELSENAGTDTWVSYLNNSEYQLINPIFTDSPNLIDSLLQPHLFYDGTDEKNIYKDIHYRSDSSKFNGLTAPAGNENMIFVTDHYGGVNNQHRIIQIDFQRSLLLELTTGDLVWAFTGEYGATVLGYGNGSEFVNQPLSLDIDYQGNLYYTQTGEYFAVHMIIPDLSGDYATYSSGFNAVTDDIMNPNLFTNPMDVAVDKNRNIYVADSERDHISVFTANGQFFKEAGYVNDDSLRIMSEPVAVTVDQRGIIYVCDKNDGAIYRYKLSNSLEEDLNLDE